MDNLHFTKMHGAGNDYIYMNKLAGSGSVDIPESCFPDLARKVSDRHFGIGSDGLIMILPSDNADFFMRIFNADGSEAQMCGNGIRCVGKYVYDKGFTRKDRLTIETLSGIKTLQLHIRNGVVDSVTVDMGEPVLKRSDIPMKCSNHDNCDDCGNGDDRGNYNSPCISETLIAGGKEFRITAVGMGNPHCVTYVDDVASYEVQKIGPQIECNELWPEKTNVEFIEVIDRNHLKMRVWERGSGETFACGTGTCAAVVASWLNGFTGRSVEVSLLGGKLTIDYDEATNHVFMTGEARFIAEGEYYY